MKKTTIAIIAAVVIIVVWIVSSYNGMVNKEESVKTAWAGVETHYQRRSDLIPNLVNTVKGYAKHESSTLEGVVKARAKATQITVDAENLTPQKIQQYQAAQGEISQALGKLLAITENYPDLKASQNFSELQAQIEGTENRIANSRDIYNKEVKDYNVSIRRFPGNIVAGIFGFEKLTPFAAEAGTEKAPNVEF